MKLKLKQFIFLTAVTVIPCLFNSCQPYHSVESSSVLGTAPTPDEPIQSVQAKAVINQYCIQCHAPGKSAGSIDFTLNSDALFVSKGYVVPGDPDQSKLIYRMLHYDGPTAGGARTMPVGYNSTSFPRSAYQVLYDWVQQMPTAPTGVAKAFECTDPEARSTSLSYSLTKQQYKNTISELFGSSILQDLRVPLSLLPEETFDSNSHERTSVLSAGKVEAYFNLANAIASLVTSNSSLTAKVFGSCANISSPSTNCINTYLNGYAKRIFRRPLTADEIAYGKQIAHRSGSYKDNLKTLLWTHLQSPHFIWRLELGQASQASTDQLLLTPYEVASRISFMAADMAPDAELMAAADADALSTLSQIKAHTLRLLQTPAGKEKVRSNLLRYAMVDKTHDFSALPAELKQGVQLSGLGDAMMDEVKTYIDHMIYTEKASFKELLTSKVSFASHPGLAAIYDHAPVTAMNAPATFSNRRQGLLMRAPFVTWPSSRTGIIVRGVKFQKRVLCNEIPPPSSVVADLRDIDELSPEEVLLHTNREAIAHKTKQPLCMSCHATINPTGFAFENIDPLGRIRTTESIFNSSRQFVRSLPVDTRVDVPVAGTTVAVQDAYDLITHVANSAEGTGCFSRNIFRFVYEKREAQEDSCMLDKVQQTIGDTGKPILDAMVELIANEAILKKKK